MRYIRLCGLYERVSRCTAWHINRQSWLLTFMNDRMTRTINSIPHCHTEVVSNCAHWTASIAVVVSNVPNPNKVALFSAGERLRSSYLLSQLVDYAESMRSLWSFINRIAVSETAKGLTTADVNGVRTCCDCILTVPSHSLDIPPCFTFLTLEFLSRRYIQFHV